MFGKIKTYLHFVEQSVGVKWNCTMEFIVWQINYHECETGNRKTKLISCSFYVVLKIQDKRIMFAIQWQQGDQTTTK